VVGRGWDEAANYLGVWRGSLTDLGQSGLGMHDGAGLLRTIRKM
jgi:hypothetical protein